MNHIKTVGVVVIVLGFVGFAAALSLPIKNPDQWIVTCTADGGAGVDINDEVDGGVHGATAAFKVVNENAGCVYLGSNGGGDSDPVNVDNGALKIGTGATCYDGPSVSVDGTATGWACTSVGGATNVRVLVGHN